MGTMDEVKFEAERNMEIPAINTPRKKGIAATLVRTGFVKTEGQANVLMVIITVVLLVGTAFLFIEGTREPRVDLPPLPVSGL